ncbi:MAG: PEP-CTERM sorting domain-containing protein [Verrucomicrobia bacterium]|nr:PEP-CTERM sorting domain-containing protein [Verrucomicrobiota bacterium]
MVPEPSSIGGLGGGLMGRMGRTGRMVVSHDGGGGAEEEEEVAGVGLVGHLLDELEVDGGGVGAAGDGDGAGEWGGQDLDGVAGGEGVCEVGFWADDVEADGVLWVGDLEEDGGEAAVGVQGVCSGGAGWVKGPGRVGGGDLAWGGLDAAGWGQEVLGTEEALDVGGMAQPVGGIA